MALPISLLASLAAGHFLNVSQPKPDKQFAWGDYSFALSQGNPLSGMTRSYDGGWVEIDLLNELPLLQQTGRKLDSISFTGRWFLAEGEDKVAELKKVRDEAKPRTLVRGDGVSLGQFVLKSFDVKGEQMIHDGTCVMQDISINLVEFANPALGGKRR
jgi:phage protein U